MYTGRKSLDVLRIETASDKLLELLIIRKRGIKIHFRQQIVLKPRWLKKLLFHAAVVANLAEDADHCLND